MVNTDPNQYLMYTDIEDFDYFWGRLRHAQGGADRRFPRLPPRASSLTSSTSSTPPSWATTWSADRAQHAAGRADRLLAARVPADLPPRRPDGAHAATRSCARRSRRGAATSASRTSAPQTFFMRKRFIQSHLGARRPLHRAERLRERALRRLGHPAPRGSMVRAVSWCRSPTGCPRSRRRAPAQPVRLLRPAQPLQGRRRAAARRWTCSARTSTATVDLRGEPREAEPTLRRSASRTLLETTRDTSRSPGAYERAELGKLMARIDWVVVPSIWWETGPLVVLGGVPARAAR